jgi:hypothetical protein
MVCLCGNEFNNYAYKMNNSYCNLTCPGDSTEMCGGLISTIYYVSVYATYYSNFIFKNHYLKFLEILKIKMKKR